MNVAGNPIGESDGVAGPVTKEAMVANRFDGDKMVQAAAYEGDTATYSKGAVIKYWVGTSPSYLDRAKLEAEIAGEWR